MTTNKTPDLPDKTNYVHTHTLPDGTTYTHSHAHKSKTSHEHTSSEGTGKADSAAKNAGIGTNNTSSVPASSDIPVDPDKLIALLTFFVGHNEQHAGELAELIPALPEEIQDKMMLAIGTLEAANVDLQEVLDYLIKKRKEG